MSRLSDMTFKIAVPLFFGFLFFVFNGVSSSGELSYDNKVSVVGEITDYWVMAEDTLHEVAMAFDLGYNEITDANPGIDPWLPDEGASIKVPSMWVLPDAPRKGIVINLAEMRLYYYKKGLLRTYPIGTARAGFSTPTGAYKIIEKIKNPYWITPESARRDDPSLPRVVRPGKENPLGTYALRLSDPVLLIHGTNRSLGVGRRVSRGCIRLYREDIKKLYDSVAPGTPVRVVYQPIKIGVKKGIVYVEVHKDYLKLVKNPLAETVSMLKKKKLLKKVDRNLLKKAIKDRTGVPVAISKKKGRAGARPRGRHH